MGTLHHLVSQLGPRRKVSVGACQEWSLRKQQESLASSLVSKVGSLSAAWRLQALKAVHATLLQAPHGSALVSCCHSHLPTSTPVFVANRHPARYHSANLFHSSNCSVSAMSLPAASDPIPNS